MLNKIKSYISFLNKKPSYHKKGTSYGGFRLDIDKYYAQEENRKKLEEINESKFPEIIRENDRTATLQLG